MAETSNTSDKNPQADQADGQMVQSDTVGKMNHDRAST